MSDTAIQINGVLTTDPFPYQSVEEREEVFLAKFQPSTPLQVADVEVAELYLNFGKTMPDLHAEEQVQAHGVLAERKMVTRSGKVRRGGVYQLLVDEWER